MKLTILSAVVLIGLVGVKYFTTKQFTNNVCKTFEDYYSDRDSNENCYHNPDHELTVPDIIKRRGYPVETHNAITKDGYNLAIFRIPHGKNSSGKKQGKPVFLQHGFATSSSCFVSTGSKSLAFILADQGYDVWLGNFRGSMYSRNHTHLSNDDTKYWDFSFHESGIYDLPAQLDLVSKFSEEKIIYIGYSMGTMAMYVYGVTYPEAALEKINIFVNLAPSAFLGEARSFLKYLVPYWFIVEPAVHMVTGGKIFARFYMPHSLSKIVCYPYPIQMKLCQLIDVVSFGFNYEQSDPETLPVSLIQGPDWASVKGLSHLIQLIISGHFQHYDYGYRTNEEVYGSPEPPHYNLTKLKIPTYFIRAHNDLMVTKENVEKLYNSLPEDVKPHDIYVIDDERFNHLDFVTAKDVVPLLYDHVVDFLRSY